MTSQITRPFSPEIEAESAGCRPPQNVPADYCRRLKSGIMRLRTAIQTHYEEMFPEDSDRIGRAMRDAEKAAWATPFPSLFFPPLAHLRMRELMPSA
jgi:hypothetical protein